MRSGKHRHLKTLHTATVFYHLIMVYQMLFISHGMVPSVGLTPHMEAIFF